MENQEINELESNNIIENEEIIKEEPKETNEDINVENARNETNDIQELNKEKVSLPNLKVFEQLQEYTLANVQDNDVVVLNYDITNEDEVSKVEDINWLAMNKRKNVTILGLTPEINDHLSEIKSKLNQKFYENNIIKELLEKKLDNSYILRINKKQLYKEYIKNYVREILYDLDYNELPINKTVIDTNLDKFEDVFNKYQQNQSNENYNELKEYIIHNKGVGISYNAFAELYNTTPQQINDVLVGYSNFDNKERPIFTTSMVKKYLTTKKEKYGFKSETELRNELIKRLIKEDLAKNYLLSGGYVFYSSSLNEYFIIRDIQYNKTSVSKVAKLKKKLKIG